MDVMGLTIQINRVNQSGCCTFPLAVAATMSLRALN